jgi:hypothetical protein
VLLTPVPGVEIFRLLSGGLRYVATTGYYLTALQAEHKRRLTLHRPVWLNL